MSTIKGGDNTDPGEVASPSNLDVSLPESGQPTNQHHGVSEETDKIHISEKEDTTTATVMGNETGEAPIDEGKEEFAPEEEGVVNTLAQRDVNESAPAIAKKKKKNKKKKPKSKRGLNAVTGFEEYYVDPPITAEEHAEEQSIYHSSLDFTERIETAIQRYVARRKLDSLKKDLFDKYLAFGGIDVGPKMFGGGLDAQSLETKNAKEIAQMTATHFVDTDKQETGSSDYVVDFNGCLKGFLSSRLPRIFDFSTMTLIKTYTGVIRNFLNYLLHHDVCPEYASQINAARSTCDRAEIELHCIARGATMLPGDFNIACSTLFGGQYETQYVGDQDWAQEMDIDKGMSPIWADDVFRTGFAAQASDEAYNEWQERVNAAPEEFYGIKARQKELVVETIDTGLEVTHIIPAHPTARSLYATQRPGLFPLGRLRVKTWHNPAAPLPELPDEELDALVADRAKNVKTYDLFLEDIVLEHCFKGMKFEATLRKLKYGDVWFFDNIKWVWCSFYEEILPNEKMIGWREIEREWLMPRESWIREMEEKAGIVSDEEGDDEGVGGMEEVEEEMRKEVGEEAAGGGDIGAVEKGMQVMNVQGPMDGGDSGEVSREGAGGKPDAPLSSDHQPREEEGGAENVVSTGAQGLVDEALVQEARESHELLQTAVENDEYGT